MEPISITPQQKMRLLRNKAIAQSNQINHSNLISMAAPTLQVQCNYCDRKFSTCLLTTEAAVLEVGDKVNKHMENEHKKELQDLKQEIQLVITNIAILATAHVCSSFPIEINSQAEFDALTTIEKEYVTSIKVAVDSVMDYLGVNEEDEEGEEEATLPSSFVEGPINQVRMGGMLPQLVKEDTEKIEDNSGADIISETLADNPTNKLVG